MTEPIDTEVAPKEAMECRGPQDCPSYGIRREIPLQIVASGVIARPELVCADCRIALWRITGEEG